MFRLAADVAAGVEGTVARQGPTGGNGRHAAPEKEGAFRLPTSLLRRITLYAFGTYVSGAVRLSLGALSRKVGSHLRNGRGVTLIEVMVAIGILGIIGPTFLGSMGTAQKATRITSAQGQAEALARSQLETIKNSAYLDCDPTPCYSTITDIPAQYNVSISVQIIDTPTCSVDSNCNTLQEVAVAISRPSGGSELPVLVVSMYKVKH